MLKKIIGYCNSIKKTQAEMKVALSEIKKTPQGNNSGGDEAEIQINDLEHKEGKKKTRTTRREKNFLKNEESIRSLWNNFKKSNICLTGVPEEKRKSKKL